MVAGLEMLKHQEGDVFLSAGNSGALMAGSLILLGRSQDIDRPALAAILPTSRGACLLLDAGLNTMCKPFNLIQFAHMGAIYAQEVMGLLNPRVGLLNVGTEDNKGNDVVKKTYQYLSRQPINFIGNIESRDVLYGAGDVLVTDGFTGNMVLKAIEGSAAFVMDSVKNIFSRRFFSKVAAALVMKDLRKLKKQLDVDEHGGAPILGINGLVIKSHGSSNARTIRHAVLRAFRLAGSTFRQRMSDMGRDLAGLNIDKDLMVI
jgi:glycerol-3-phosphate acyltransferase PlsX